MSETLGTYHTGNSMSDTPDTEEKKECPVCTADEKCWECADDVSTEGGK